MPDISYPCVDNTINAPDVLYTTYDLERVMIGTKLGPYELVEEVGHGGMATVFRAFQPNVDRFVAVKVIHRSVSLDSKSLDRFTREARLVARLEHPHILPVYDYNGVNDPPYIVMRYLPTGTLKDILERDQLHYEEVAYLLSQISSALDYARPQDVAHPHLPPAVNLVVMKAMAKNPDDRYATSTEMARALSAALGTSQDMTPVRLQAVAAQTIIELEKERAELAKNAPSTIPSPANYCETGRAH